MKIFWAWQSDIDADFSRYFIKKCIEKAIIEINEEAVFTDRLEIDHDTKDIPGSPSITDTIFKKIKECSVFIADVTPVAQTSFDKVKRIMNPNVAIEMGYALATLGDSKIISVMNNKFGSVEDLPFDIKHKRGPINYSLNSDSNKDEMKNEERNLVAALKNALKLHKNSYVDQKEININYDLNGPAIYYDLDKPIIRLPGDGFSVVKDKGYYPAKTNSYIYIKIIPQIDLKFSKRELKDSMFSDGKFNISPLHYNPDNTPEVNKYGALVISFDRTNKNQIADFVQLMENGTIISISNSFLNIIKNKIHLSSFKKLLERSLSDGIQLLSSIIKSDCKLLIEIGLVNNDNCVIILPNPTGHRFYPQAERGPLEKEKYIIKREVKINDKNIAEKIVKEYILSILDDLGIDFNFDEHIWR